MGQIEDLRLFVLIVETGSISKAADKLSIAKSAVSRRLNLLEERYGTRLIDRTPGVWAITETGRELFQRAIRVVGDVNEIEDDFVNASASISGPMSVSVPRDFGISFLNSALIGFAEHYPEIQLTVDFDDRTVDLARENYDFAIRIKPEVDEPAVRIGSVQHQFLASPDYLEARSTPRSIEELRQRRLLYFGSARRAIWDFMAGNGKQRSFEFQPFLNSNSGVFLVDAARRGLGIGRFPDFMANDAVAKGELVPVSLDMRVPEWGVYLIHAEDRRLNRRMRLFAEAMKKACI